MAKLGFKDENEIGDEQHHMNQPVKHVRAAGHTGQSRNCQSDREQNLTCRRKAKLNGFARNQANTDYCDQRQWQFDTLEACRPDRQDAYLPRSLSAFASAILMSPLVTRRLISARSDLPTATSILRLARPLSSTWSSSSFTIFPAIVSART
jgi:hypothetical protein